jgi:hypothetical protein
MKTGLILAASILIVGCANAQTVKEAEVPASVKTAFEKKFPGSKVKEWEKEGADYEAEFDLKKVETSAVFDANGMFKEVEQEIKMVELPKAAMEYCTKTYPVHKLSEAAKITDASGKIMYEAELKKGKTHFDVLFDDKGTFIKQTEVETGKD